MASSRQITRVRVILEKKRVSDQNQKKIINVRVRGGVRVRVRVRVHVGVRGDDGVRVSASPLLCRTHCTHVAHE